MTSTVTCSVGLSKASLSECVPRSPFQLGDKALANYFGEGSGGQIDLRFREDHTAKTINENWVADNYQLNLTLEALTGNSRYGQGPVDRIGLIFSDKHEINARSTAAPPILGAMFDRGFHPAPPTGDLITRAELFEGIPREGCAVFVSTIRDLFDEPAVATRQIVLTMAHEIGHVFNLWHLDKANEPLGIMSSYKRHKGSLSASNLRFPPKQDDFLALCGRSRYVTPGGSKFKEYGDLRQPPEYLRTAQDSGSTPLSLSIGADPAEFWAFEPIELDVVLSANGSAVEVPHELDPGYDGFRIWIECPSGRRVRYRPTVHYCPHGTHALVGGQDVLSRDISLFGCSGGYTFDECGPHTIQAEFDVGDGETVRSNAYEVMVRPADHGSKRYELLKFLTEPAIARLLYYRDGPRRRRFIERAQAVIGDLSGEPAGAGLSYALGRMLARAATSGYSSSTTRRYKRLATNALGVAMDSPRLAERRRVKSAQLLDDLQQL